MSGRVTSSFYAYERLDNSYWRAYLGFNSAAVLWRGDRNHCFGFHSNVRWTGDMAGDELGIPQTYVYDLHLRLAGYPAGSTIYFGRQFAFNALGSSLIDGVRTKLRITRSVGLDLFAGATVAHERPEQIGSLGDRGMYGSTIDYSPTKAFWIGLNWFARRSGGSFTKHRAGVSTWREMQRVELYSQVSYDLVDLEMAEVLARVSVPTRKWYLSADYHWRKPSVDDNTVFSLIDAHAYSGVRTEVTRAVWHDFRLLGQMQYELMTGEDAWRTVLGVRATPIMIGWHHRDGYGGESDGLQVQANLNLTRALETYCSTLLSRYIVQPETPDRIDAYSSSMGLLWRPGRATQIRVEGQYLRNATDKSDVRLFVNLTKGFHVGAGRPEAGK